MPSHKTDSEESCRTTLFSVQNCGLRGDGQHYHLAKDNGAWRVVDVAGSGFPATEEDATQAVPGLAAVEIDEASFTRWLRANVSRSPQLNNQRINRRGQLGSEQKSIEVSEPDVQICPARRELGMESVEFGCLFVAGRTAKA